MTTSEPIHKEPIDEKKQWPFNHFIRRETNRLRQVLTGFPVGHDETVACTACHQPLPEGASVTVYAYRPCGDATWAIPRVYCREDTPSVTGTLGVWDALATAHVGTLADVATQSHHAALVDPDVTTVRAPTQGTTVYSPVTIPEGKPCPVS